MPQDLSSTGSQENQLKEKEKNKNKIQTLDFLLNKIMALKILACGDVNGNFTTFFKRINSVNAKNGPFEMVVCVGDFFGSQELSEENAGLWNEIKKGQSKVPCPIYLLGPKDESQKSHFPDIEGCELAPDVIYLGRIGLLTTSQGLKLAYASPNVDFQAVKALEIRSKCEESDFQGVDILLGSEWPLGLGSGDDQVQKTDGLAMLSRLAVKLRPRYHFAGNRGVFFERTPYRNHRVMAQKQRHVTRFIALADVGNKEKKKWIYAFNIVPMKNLSVPDLVAQPPSVTDMPYNESHMKAGAEQKSSQFFYDMKTPMEDNNRKRKAGEKHEHQRNKRPPPQPTGPCWFCKYLLFE